MVGGGVVVWGQVGGEAEGLRGPRGDKSSQQANGSRKLLRSELGWPHRCWPGSEFIPLVAHKSAYRKRNRGGKRERENLR